jgi:hypothetical protein
MAPVLCATATRIVEMGKENLKVNVVVHFRLVKGTRGFFGKQQNSYEKIPNWS